MLAQPAFAKTIANLLVRRGVLLKQNVFFRRSATGEPLWTDTYVYALLAAEID